VDAFFARTASRRRITREAIANPIFQTEAAMSESTTLLAPVFGEATVAGMPESVFVLALLFGSLLFVGLLVFLGVSLNTWWNSRQEASRAEREAALKREMLDRGLSVDEIERLIRATAEPPTKIEDEDIDALGELGGVLGTCEPEAKPETIEEILAIARTADSKMRRAMVSAVSEMHGNAGTITDEQIRAVVRALARPAGPSTPSTPPVVDVPPFTSAASRITDAFHLPE
jgi:hypothetical protein